MAGEIVFSAVPAFVGGGRVIASPFQFLFTGEDHLQVVIANAKAGVVVQLSGRFLETGTPTPQDFSPTFTPTADRVANVFTVGMGNGFLLNLSAIVLSGSPLIGQTYVMVRIIRGLTGATAMLGALLGGYITAQQPLAYPGSVIESSTAGEPAARTIVGTAPAAGAEVLETVPAGARWELMTVRQQFITSAVAISRTPNFLFKDPTNRLYRTVNTTVLNSNITAEWFLAQNLPVQSDVPSSIFTLPIPQPTRLLTGQTWGTTTAGLQAGDQYAAPVYAVREWLEVN